MIFVLSALFLILDVVWAHGRLSVPTTRFPSGYENDPVPSNNDDTFVCRNDVTTPATTLTAGSTTDLYWDFGAAHVGDCAVYISYDWDASTNSEQNYFKIANLFKCKDQNRVTVPIDLPSWLPAGRAVLRWDWYALHVYPTVEFYSQCADVTIEAGSDPVDIDTLTKYPIINPALYPATGTDGVGYRNPFGNGEQYMTGPPCAAGYTENDCALTASGTTGYINVGDITPVASPTPKPTSPGDPLPTEQPTVASECEIYEVLSGDTISAIADAYAANDMAVTWQEICDFNELEDCDTIDIGDNLMIPCATCGCTLGGTSTSSKSSNVPQTVIGVVLTLGGIIGALWLLYRSGYRIRDNKIININTDQKQTPPIQRV